MRTTMSWLVFPVWVITRVVLFLAATQVLPVGQAGAFSTDIALYHEWSQILLGGQFPEGDERWQYPPFAVLPMLAPHVLPGDYRIAFYLLALLCDGAILLLLWRFAAGQRYAGAWAWTVGAALLGPVLISRYDLMVTVVAVLALTASTGAAARGSLIGLGFAIKVWPIALLAGLRRGRQLWIASGTAVLFAVLACGMAALVMPHAFDFLTAQRERGIQIESLFGTPFALARALGWWEGFTTYQHGAMEVVGPGVEAAKLISVMATPTAASLVVVWWLWARLTPRSYYDAALTMVLVLVLTSRVLSPQYLVWLVAIAAVVVSAPPDEPGRAVSSPDQRPAAWLVLVAALLTGIMYPWVEEDYSWSGELPGTLLLVLRNLVLLAAGIVSYVQLWRSTRGTRVIAASYPKERRANPESYPQPVDG